MSASGAPSIVPPITTETTITQNKERKTTADNTLQGREVKKGGCQPVTCLKVTAIIFGILAVVCLIALLSTVITNAGALQGAFNSILDVTATVGGALGTDAFTISTVFTVFFAVGSVSAALATKSVRSHNQDVTRKPADGNAIQKNETKTTEQTTIVINKQESTNSNGAENDQANASNSPKDKPQNNGGPQILPHIEVDQSQGTPLASEPTPQPTPGQEANNQLQPTAPQSGPQESRRRHHNKHKTQTPQQA